MKASLTQSVIVSSPFLSHFFFNKLVNEFNSSLELNKRKKGNSTASILRISQTRRCSLFGSEVSEVLLEHQLKIQRSECCLVSRDVILAAFFHKYIYSHIFSLWSPQPLTLPLPPRGLSLSVEKTLSFNEMLEIMSISPLANPLALMLLVAWREYYSLCVF